jgi:hypothetical protein
VTENRNAVARQVHVGFDAAHAGIESRLERRQRIFWLKRTGAAMALQIEQWRHCLIADEKKPRGGNAVPREASGKKVDSSRESVQSPNPNISLRHRQRIVKMSLPE